MRSNYLGDKPFWRVTARLALPIAIQNVLTSSFQLVDTLMVSRLGDVTLSAVGMAAQWGWLSNLLGFGLCSGMSVFVAQYWGVRDFKGIRRVLGMGLLTALLLTAIFLAVALAAPSLGGAAVQPGGRRWWRWARSICPSSASPTRR